jgi:uroporphyrinogen-III synthase
MPDPMLLWVTRSSPFNLRTSRVLAELGHRSIIAPVLKIRPIGILTPVTEPTAIAFTSGHGILHYPNPFREKWRSLPVFTVGRHSADLARARGHTDVRSADGNVSDLRDLILGSVSRFGHVVHFGALESAGDLVGDLRNAGLGAEHIAVYESTETTAEQLKSVAVGLPHVDGIIAHSPKGAAVAAELARRTRWHGIVFALSEACAKAFERVPGVAVETALAPTETALMDLVAMYRPPAFVPPNGVRALPRFGAEREGANTFLRLVASNDASQPDPAIDGSPSEPDDPPPFAA